MASSTGSAKATSPSLHVVFLGVPRKSLLFDKMCSAASAYERHAAYPDTHYLTLCSPDNSTILEVNDPGLARTGGREMAVRTADAILLFYSECSAASFTALADIPALLSLRKKACPVRVICDVDEEEAECNSSGVESVSEGYESDRCESSSSLGIRRRESMEKIKEARENQRVDLAQGEELAARLGAFSRLQRVSLLDFTSADALQLLQEMLEAAKAARPPSKSLSISLPLNLKKIKNRSKSMSTESKDSPRSPPHNQAVPLPSSPSPRLPSHKPTQSRACTIM